MWSTRRVATAPLYAKEMEHPELGGSRELLHPKWLVRELGTRFVQSYFGMG